MVENKRFKCDSCNHEFEDGEILWYCENCEEYSDEDCVSKHIDHDIFPLKYVNNEFNLIRMTAYGGGFGSYEWSLFNKEEFLKDKKLACEHVLYKFNNHKPVINVYENGLYCCDCFNNNYENLRDNDKFGDPFVLLEDNQNVRHLYYDLYETRHLKYFITYPKESGKGKHAPINIIIENLKNIDIKDVYVTVSGFSAPPLDENDENFLYSLECMDNKLLISKYQNIPIIKTKNKVELSFDIYIPKDYELKPSDVEKDGSEFIGEKLLPVPNPLTIYFSINFKNEFGVMFNDYIGSKTINLK